MGGPVSRSSNVRFGVAGPSGGTSDAPAARLEDAQPSPVTVAAPPPAPMPRGPAKPGAQAPASGEGWDSGGDVGLLGGQAAGGKGTPRRQYQDGDANGEPSPAEPAAAAMASAAPVPTPAATGGPIGLGSIGTIGHGSGSTPGLGASGAGRGGGGVDIARNDKQPELIPLQEAAAEKNNMDGREQLKAKDEGERTKREGKADTSGTVDGYMRTDVSVVMRVLTPSCSAAAALPIDERAALWRERLSNAGTPASIANVYRQALASCEAPAQRERSRLLQLMLDASKTAAGRVSLWRLFMTRPEGDILYRGMLSRVRTPDEMRELHAALGLRTIDTSTLKKLLEGATSPADKVAKLRELLRQWPDDFALALVLLDALEDVGDQDGARDLGKKLRARPDADARLRTAVGELFLRLAAVARSPEEKAADEAEARRAFGEIVEFAPDDPVARRRLGDLLRAHGWFDEAARQYETLAKLTPDDPAVYLLLAAAAEGLGKLEEAVKWTEKAGASGAPDMPQSSAQTARALAITYLAWERDAARKAGRKDDVDALSVRAERILSGARAGGAKTSGTRATLVWSHPDLHPTLWSNALGAAMPAPEQDMAAGVAQAVVPRREDAFVEVRIDPEDAERAARLGATATLTVISNEGEAEEKIHRFVVKLGPGPAATQRFRINGTEVTP